MRTPHFVNPPSLHLGSVRCRAVLAALAIVLSACGGSADAPPPLESGGPAGVAPSITLQPVDATVAAAATATFTSAATGTPSPTVQWQQSTDSGDTWTPIVGPTSTSFTTPTTVLADNNKLFRAVFSNTAGSATSNGARLTVTAASSTGLRLLAGDIGGGGNIDGTGAGARFAKPDGVAVDTAGNLYIADTANHTIRKITPAGVVSTLAGLAGNRGNVDGTGTAARFSDPTGVAVDGSGNVFVADFGNNVIRKITPAGVVSTFAGGPSAAFSGTLGIAIDPASGTLYVADEFNNTIRKITPAGVVSTLAGQPGVGFGDNDGTGAGARFSAPNTVAVDAAGNVYVAEGGHVIRKITPAGVVTTIAGQANVTGSVDGTGAAALFAFPRGIAVDAAGNVYVTDANNCRVRMITPAGVVTTLAGAQAAFSSVDGTGAAATFNFPAGIAVDAAGKVYVTEEDGNVIRAVTPAGVVTTIAGAPALFGNVDSTGAAARFAFGGQKNTAVDASGNVYVGDFGNQAIRKITPAGVVSTFVGPAANIATNGGLAIDALGNLFVGDTNDQTIREITPAGVVSLLAGSGTQGSADGMGAAASFGDPSGLAVDSAGNVYVADSINGTIRKITPAGLVTTLAGTAGVEGSADDTGAAASFSDPIGIAVDASGNVYVADSGNNTIRKVTPAGVVSTLAGTAGVTGSADGTGAAAGFSFPSSLAVDSTGNLYVADSSNSAVRKITPLGVVTTIVGVPGQIGVRLGSDPRLAGVTGISLSGDRRLVFSSANGVFTFDLP